GVTTGGRTASGGGSASCRSSGGGSLVHLALLENAQNLDIAETAEFRQTARFFTLLQDSPGTFVVDITGRGGQSLVVGNADVLDITNEVTTFNRTVLVHAEADELLVRGRSRVQRIHTDVAVTNIGHVVRVFVNQVAPAVKIEVTELVFAHFASLVLEQ